MDPKDVNVADSTDWLNTTLACLMPVEQAFRCHVCKDFYNSPMITSCNHTFCSLCIRRCLSVDGRCPLCRMTDQESKLRGSWALREAIDAFCQARTTILDVARRPVPQAEPITGIQTVQAAAKRKMSEPAAQSPTSDSQPSYQEPQAKRTRSSARLGKIRVAEGVASIAQDELVADLPSCANSSDGGDTDYEPDDGLVACPICHRRMKMALINSHLDSACSNSPKKPNSTTHTLSKNVSSTTPFPSGPFLAASMTIPPPERLPSVSYSLLNDSALRKKMGALGLATFGSRQLLERRHKEWTTIWNANCDSARPKRRGELLHDMDIWERTIGVATSSGVGASGTLGGIGTGATGGRGPSLTSRAIVAANQQSVQIKDKDFDAAAWSAKHELSFQDLIANARKSRSKQQEKTQDDASDAQSANLTAGGKEQLPEHRIEDQPLKDEPQALNFTGLATEESTVGSNNVFELGDSSNERSGALTGNDTPGEKTIAPKPDNLLGDRAGFELT